MELHQIPRSIFKQTPPPLWYVTNGELTVGPVVTGLLIRGVGSGARARVLPGQPVSRRLARVDLGARNCRADQQDQRQRAERGTIGGVDPTGRANQGRVRVEPHGDLVVVDDDGRGERDVSLPRSQPTLADHALGDRADLERAPRLRLAGERLGVESGAHGPPCPRPPYGPTEDALAIRFASSRGGVGAAAMIPIFIGEQLTAMLELSRPGHAFRRSDLQRAERIAQRAVRPRAN